MMFVMMRRFDSQSPPPDAQVSGLPPGVLCMTSLLSRIKTCRLPRPNQHSTQPTPHFDHPETPQFE